MVRIGRNGVITAWHHPRYHVGAGCYHPTCGGGGGGVVVVVWWWWGLWLPPQVVVVALVAVHFWGGIRSSRAHSASSHVKGVCLSLQENNSIIVSYVH